MALSQLMNESSELLMMITQAVKNDLNSTTSNFIVSLALTSIAEVSTEDMYRELYTEVKKLMKSTSSYIKKRQSCLQSELSETFQIPLMILWK